MPAGIALLIGILVCFGAVLGLLATYYPPAANENDSVDAPGQERGNLVMAFLLGLALLWFVLSGRYVMAPVSW